MSEHTAASVYHQGRLDEAIERLSGMLQGRRVAVLTGAGCSTDSGIPDYRSPKSRKVKRAPIQYQDFVNSAAARQRYWARSYLGWPRFRTKEPNIAHHTLTTLEKQGAILGLITQNVDRLHHKAGSQRIIELHGTLSQARCLECKLFEDRDHLQERLHEHNPSWEAEVLALRPDGDAELPEDAYHNFTPVACLRCEGVMKPYVVFFGENVEKDIVDSAWKMVDEAEMLLVIGSSLTVYSGYRFVKGAAEKHKPVAIINIGETRGDPHATLRIDAPIGETLPALANALTP